MKAWRIKDRVDDAQFIEICNSSDSMAKAASRLGLHFNSFKKRAFELGCYKPNQAGEGISKKKPWIPLEEIIEDNLHPHYQTYKLKQRLLAQKIKKNQCESCKITDWKGKKISMELHHIDGNRTSHHISNLSMLCPNCHSQTSNYRAKNKN